MPPSAGRTQSMCECMSMKPGATTSPSQSIVFAGEFECPRGYLLDRNLPFIITSPLKPGTP